MFKELMKNVEERNPLIHCITNQVTMNDCANALLAVKGSPIMADDEDEVEEMTTLCQGLVVNIGTLNQRTIQSMIKAGKKANVLGHPVVLDPVGVGATKLRTETVFQLLKEIKWSVIKGNVSEMKVIAYGKGITKGVDANEKDVINEDNLESYIEFAKNISQQTEAIIVMTGAIDIVANHKTAYIIRNGCKEMSKVTGTGCMLGAILGAYISANPKQMLEASTLATSMMGFSGELAKQRIIKEELGTGSLHIYLIDYLSRMNYELLSGGMNIEKR